MYHWDDRYCIGEPEIDSQHRKLFQICERIMKNLLYGDDERTGRTIAEAVKYLKSYTLDHFAHEEVYQCSIGYEGFAEHRQKHEEFKRTILREEKLMVGSGYAPQDVERFVKIVNDWLVEHIMRCDQAITPGKQ